jgi:hypothetical protein
MQAIASQDTANTAPVNLDLISTLTTGYILDQYVTPQADPVKVLGRLPGAVEAQTRAKALASFTAGAIEVPHSLTSADVNHTVNGLRAQDAALDSQLDTVKHLLVVGGSASVTDGPALAAQLNRPVGVVFDAAGNAYIADSGNNLIRKQRHSFDHPRWPGEHTCRRHCRWKSGWRGQRGTLQASPWPGGGYRG